MNKASEGEKSGRHGHPRSARRPPVVCRAVIFTHPRRCAKFRAEEPRGVVYLRQRSLHRRPIYSIIYIKIHIL
ncbi:MAG: DUF1156 domain-containing protein [Anaerolineae bacterium]|nr:DUF1156 domain-containing protein [Anaerolineae bacterium]